MYTIIYVDEFYVSLMSQIVELEFVCDYMAIEAKQLSFEVDDHHRWVEHRRKDLLTVF